MLALRQLVDQRWEIDREKVTVFSTLEPCLMCCGALLVNGIRRVVYAYEDVMGGGTSLDFKKLGPLYNVDLVITPHILRQESLALLKTFFSDPKNDYLRGTLLAEYTLRQDEESAISD
jgi:tRNA(adenine34) deaminase